MSDILDEVKRQKAHFGEPMQPPSSEEAIKKLVTEAKQNLKADVPMPYLAFLRRTNGLDWNGTIFFAAQNTPYHDNPQMTLEGFVEANQRLREAPVNKKFLVFGESGMEMYVLDLSTGKFNIVDHISTDVYESFHSFDELLHAALQKRLLQDI